MPSTPPSRAAASDKLRDLRRSYDTGPVVASLVAPLVLTALAQGVTAWLTSYPALDGAWGLTLPWLAWALASVAILLVRAQLQRWTAPTVPWGFWLQGVLQHLWVVLLAWYCHPSVSFFAVFVLCTAAFSDARYFHDAAPARWHSAACWLGCVLFLLTLDAVGLPGLLTRHARDPQYTALAGVVGGGVLLMQQFILSVVGAQWRKLDAQAVGVANLQAEVAAMQRERSVIARSCDFLARGVAASRFSHDVSSPISVVSLSIDSVADSATALESALASEVGDVNRRAKAALGVLLGAVDDARLAIARVTDLADGMARSLRAGPGAEQARLSELIARATELAAMALARHPHTHLKPVVTLQDCSVWITGEHAGAVSTVLANAILQNPRQQPELAGGPISDAYAVLSVRDYGVAEEHCAEALNRIESSLALTAEPQASLRDETYAGYGVGLLLGKLVLVRSGGWLRARAPTSGRGVCLDLLIPRLPLAELEAADPPELALSQWANQLD
jgi:signal transduction histidine kinase